MSDTPFDPDVDLGWDRETHGSMAEYAHDEEPDLEDED